MLAVRHAERAFPARLVVVGDLALLRERAARVGAAAHYAAFDPASFAPVGGIVEVIDQPVVVPATPGHPDPTNAACVIAMLGRAADGCATGAFAALVTAPVQKSVMQDAGIAFSGHTEFFAARAHVPRVVMLLVGGGLLRVALVTTHLAAAAVPAAITPDAVGETLAIVAAELSARFGIAAPRIAVCGLNPHAGEGGHLGREEIDVIAPAIAAARAAGIDATGPHSGGHRVRAGDRATASMRSSRCTTTRACRRSRRRASATAST